MTARPSRTSWRICRPDLAAGGGALLWLVHPLLPDFTSAAMSEDGLVLGPGVPAPSPVAEGMEPAEAGPFFVRLLGLLGFLRWAGMGVRAEDIRRIGRGRGRRPALGAAPVPEWRAFSPALAVSALAVLASGEREGDLLTPGDIERAASGTSKHPFSRIAMAAVRSEERGERPESLLARLARELDVREDGADQLGLLYPVCAGGLEGSRRPAWAAGRAGLYLARGAIRRGGRALSFVEGAPAGLEEGSALLRCAAALGKDPRARDLRALAAGEAPTGPGGGPPLALLAKDLPQWDLRSRMAYDALRSAEGLLRFETREGAPAPWENRQPIAARFGLAEVSSTLYLPFAALPEAIATWEEVARLARDDAGRFLLVARSAASRFSAAEGDVPGCGRAPSAPRRGPDPVIDAASLLADGFDAAEAAAAAGVSEEAARSRLGEEAAAGRLAEEEEGRYRFFDPARRKRVSARLSPAERSSVVARLPPSTAEPRMAIAGLSRGNPADIALARGQLVLAVRDENTSLARALVERAPASDPDLGAPLLAAMAHYSVGAHDEARRAAGRAGERDLRAVEEGARSRYARLLARLGEKGKALVLAGDGSSPESLLLRIRVLLDARRNKEAAALLAAGAPQPDGAHPGFAVRWAVLLAESAARSRDYPVAERELAGALALLDEDLDPEAAVDAASTAGWLASDLCRHAESAVFFRRALDLAKDEGRRADARADLAASLYLQGKHEEAGRELGDAMSYFASTGDSERYVSALGNRADLFLATGDLGGARADLERVLLFDRDPARAFQFLFTAPSAQKLALMDGAYPVAEGLFDEARERLRSFATHDAKREILILEGARRLACGDPGGASEVLEEAGREVETRSRNEKVRSRLVASAGIDVGRAGPWNAALEREEVRLLEAERRLFRGEDPGAEALRVFTRRAGLAREAGDVSARLLEWVGRFPGGLTAERARPFLELGLEAAERAGLGLARARFADLLAATAPPLASPASQPRGAVPPRKAQRAPIAEEESTRATFTTVAQVAPTSLAVLILGETGTGKEVVARELHRLSGRGGPFVAVNVAAIPDTLAEAELFGHARGAFTGADRERRGLIEESSSGTLFLDEIGELPPLVQAKLLRVLQERSIRRVGETRERLVDLRVVSATHRDLSSRIAAGSFRQDLYYRLAGAELTLPPLRERPKDLAALVEKTLGGRIALSPRARKLVLGHRWPGNIRELISALESAEVLAGPGRTIDVCHLPKTVRAAGEPASPPGGRGRYREAVEEARRRAILDALGEASGNRTRAALLLGLSRQSLLYEMKKLKLDGREWRIGAS